MKPQELMVSPFRSPRGTIPAVLAVLVAVFVLAVGCEGSAKDEETAGADATAPDPRAIMAFGTVTAAETREILLPFDARIVDIPVWTGSRVEKGEVLMVLDSRDLRRAEDAVRLEWEAADMLLKESISRLDALDVQVGEARAQADRLDRLNSGGSVSAQDMEVKKAELEALQHDRAAAAWTVETRRREAEGKRLLYEEFQEKLSSPYIADNAVVCPVAIGVVTEIPVRPGAEVAAGTLVLVLDDTSSLMVEADLSEEFVRDVSPGIEATVIPLADPERRYTGTVSALAGRAVLLNGETVVKTRISLTDADDGFLRAGFNVDVEIIPREKK